MRDETHCAVNDFIRILVIVIASLAPSAAFSDNWQKFENNHFLVYSQGKPERVEEIVHELELFRSAALQVFSIRPPDDAPKTIVVIARNTKEYNRIGGPPGTGGIAYRHGTRTLILMPDIGLNKDDKMNTVRHEYAHALLGYDNFNYPQWYDEGFAELAALIEIDEANGSFVLGRGSERRIGRFDGLINWDHLIRDSFNAHSYYRVGRTAAAYGQAWLLMHYLTLGPNKENAERLANYVVGLKNGVSSTEAFQSAFGKSAFEMWQTELSDYPSRLPYYTLKFRGLELDKNFVRSPAPDQELEPLLNFLMMPTMSRKAKRLKGLTASDFEGFWEPVNFDSRCKVPIEIRYDSQADTFGIRWLTKRGTETREDFIHYANEPARGGSRLLTQLNAEEGNDEAQLMPAFELSIRKGDLMCVTRTEDKDHECMMALNRCETP